MDSQVLLSHFAGSDNAEVSFLAQHADRGSLFLLNAQFAEVFHYFAFQVDAVFVRDHLLAVHHYIYGAVDRTVQGIVGAVDNHDQFTGLVRFNGSQSYLSVHEQIFVRQRESHGQFFVSLVGIFDFARTYFAFLDGTEVHLFGFEAKFAGFVRIVVNGFSRLRDNLTLDLQFLGSLGSVAGYGDGLLEASRAAVGVVGNGYLTGLSRFDGLACPFRCGATAAGTYVAQHEGFHTFVLQGEHGCYATIGFVDLTEVMFCFLECDNGFLSHHCHGAQYEREAG